MRLISLIIILLFLINVAASLLSEDTSEIDRNIEFTITPFHAGNLGDINGDCRRDTADIPFLIRYIIERPENNYEADLDQNGRLNIFDLLALLRWLALTPERELEFILVIEHIRVDEHTRFCLDVYTDTPEPQVYNYRIFANKNIEEAIFIFGADTIMGIQGNLPVIFDRDTLPSVDQIEIGKYPWHVRVKDTEGNLKEVSGNVEICLLIDCLCDPVYPRVGNPIDFPLVLTGTDQKFAVKLSPWDPDKFTIDLNRSGSSMVVFTDIKNLASEIMQDLSEHNPEWQEAMNNQWVTLKVSPALDHLTDKTTDRLVFSWPEFGAMPVIESVNGNEELLIQLGFPFWLRNIPERYFDSRYRFGGL